MKPKQILPSLAVATALAFGAGQAMAEELSVATFIPPQHHINSFFFKWFGEEVEERSGGYSWNANANRA